MRAVQACSLQSKSFRQPDDLSRLTEAYGIDADAIAVEAPLAKASLRGKDMENIGDALRELAPLKVAFPCQIKVVHIALTLAMSSATCERSFSALKQIKTYRCSTMTEPRLNDLAILSIERYLSKTLDLNVVVQNFATIKIVELHYTNVLYFCSCTCTIYMYQVRNHFYSVLNMFNE